MVSFKKLFFATSLLLSGVAAAPSPAGTLSVAAAEVRAVNDFAIESRDLNTIDAAAKPKPKKNCGPTKRNSLERRVLHAGSNANQVMENEYVTAMQIKNNGGKATVADLSGCTAIFFYMDTTLRRVVHILCGNEATDAKTAAQEAAGSDSVTIGAATQANFDAAKKGVLDGSPNIKVNPQHIYSTAKVTDTIAITLHGSDGAKTLTDGTGARRQG
ncbi:hypothetical protein ACMFMG_007952 [Clarireedia jacksonii]